MINPIYVTFRVDYVVTGRKHYAVRCENSTQLREALADINSLDGVTNIRINYCGRLPKNTIVKQFGDPDYLS